MGNHSYELKRTSLTQNSYQVITVRVDMVYEVNWRQYACAPDSGGEYSSRNMREAFIDELYYSDQLKIAKPENCTDMQYGYKHGIMIIGAKYYDSRMEGAGHPQVIADELYSTVVNKVSGLVARHFEIFMANELHTNVVKRAAAKASGGDRK